MQGLQSSIDAEMNLTKAEVQKAIISNILSTSPGSCNSTGWTRVAFLNMIDTAEFCPSTLSMITSPVRGCGQRLATAFTFESIHITLNSKITQECVDKLLPIREEQQISLLKLFIGIKSLESAYWMEYH